MRVKRGKEDFFELLDWKTLNRGKNEDELKDVIGSRFKLDRIHTKTLMA